MTEFQPFRKVPRLSRECTITEKIDGTNACIFIGEDREFLVGKRSSWITPEADNHGFARWAYENRDDLMGLGAGYHFGEWWGSGIQRRYGVAFKRFSLFNTFKWSHDEIRPPCCGVVPVLYTGPFTTEAIAETLERLRTDGSVAVPGCMNPEGVMIYHHAAKTYFKKTLEKDEAPKGEALAA